MSVYPLLRKRRLRHNPIIRDTVAETTLPVSSLVYPLFFLDRHNTRLPITSMPGVFQQSIDYALQDIEHCLSLGVKSFLLFGIPEEKDHEASQAWSEDGVTQRTLKAIKKRFGHDVYLIADTCLCAYMTHGHCGVVMGGKILNDPSVALLSQVAVSQAQAGADMIAPSDMMDGRIMGIRNALDEAGYTDTPILSYAVKYASAFYGPFREAAHSAPSFGDRRTYQMDARNVREALDEARLDVEEGADMLMVKPAMAYLDILAQLHAETMIPLAAYAVSGEYAMIKAAAQNGWIDERSVVLESLTAVRRAGASMIITYHAPQVAQWIL
jgi:porphobilinogen synthase